MKLTCVTATFNAIAAGNRERLVQLNSMMVVFGNYQNRIASESVLRWRRKFGRI